mgnify:CR=1 FL=1
MLEHIKLLLGFTDNAKDELLNYIISVTSARLAILLGLSTVPEALSYIVEEVSVVRYNRIASEGLEHHAVEGETQIFYESDFTGYTDDISAWLAAQDDPENGKGRLRFL